VLGGAPSTLHALVTGRDPLAATRAAGSLLPGRRERGGGPLVGAAVHAAISVGWAMVLVPLLRRARHPVAAGLAAGAAVAGLDLAIAQRKFPAIAALPTGPQVADHLAFGALLGAVVHRRR